MLYAIDIGSTIIKVVNTQELEETQQSYERNYDLMVSTQVENIIKDIKAVDGKAQFKICSSANGGLKVGIISLTLEFSGLIVNNLSTSAGANVLYLKTLFDIDEYTQLPPVDVLIITGSVNANNNSIFNSFLKKMDLSKIDSQIIVFAGNEDSYGVISDKTPNVLQVNNPINEQLKLNDKSLLILLRNIYLNDIVQKEGIHSLHEYTESPIWPTPAIVNSAFHALALQKLENNFPTPFIIVDIGGATTDVHFGLEILDENEGETKKFHLEDNRFVFTELGVHASKVNTIKKLKEHSKIFDFLSIFSKTETNQYYEMLMRESLDKEILFYACLFIALDTLLYNEDEFTPILKLNKLSAVIVTGGASKCISKKISEKILTLILYGSNNKPSIIIDQEYTLWSKGMSFVNYGNVEN